MFFFQNEALHRDIVRLFADQSTAPLSIHKIVEMGQTTINARPGDWFGPGSTAHLLRKFPSEITYYVCKNNLNLQLF